MFGGRRGPLLFIVVCLLRADFEKAKVDKERWGVCKGEMVVIKSNCPAYVEAFEETQGNWQESFARFCGLQGSVDEVTTMTSKVEDAHGNKAQCGKVGGAPLARQARPPPLASIVAGCDPCLVLCRWV